MLPALRKGPKKVTAATDGTPDEQMGKLKSLVHNTQGEGKALQTHGQSLKSRDCRHQPWGWEIKKAT